MYQFPRSPPLPNGKLGNKQTDYSVSKTRWWAPVSFKKQGRSNCVPVYSIKGEIRTS